MAKPGLRKIHRYSEEFKTTAVRLSHLPGVAVQDLPIPFVWKISAVCRQLQIFMSPHLRMSVLPSLHSDKDRFWLEAREL